MNKLLVILALAAVGFAATGQRTTRTGLKAVPAEQAPVNAALDTLASPEPHIVDVNGYDKPLRSRRETFFATNNGKSPVARLAFTITYLDSKGRQLHKASHNVETDIPAGETRQVSVRSWDAQQSFYYMRSTAPARVAQATPYDVKISVDTIFTR